MIGLKFLQNYLEEAFANCAPEIITKTFFAAPPYDVWINVFT